jgi:hypothetical protein
MDDTLNFILNILKTEQKQYIILNNLQETFFKHILDISDRIFICMALMTDSFRWNTKGVQFKSWIDSPLNLPLNIDADMCCYESVMYALWLSKITSKEKLIKSVKYFTYMNLPKKEMDVIFRRLSVKFNITTKEQMKIPFEKESIYDPLGCLPQVAEELKNRVNICFTCSSEINTEINPNYCEIIHYFLSYKGIVIHIK